MIFRSVTKPLNKNPCCSILIILSKINDDLKLTVWRVSYKVILLLYIFVISVKLPVVKNSFENVKMLKEKIRINALGNLAPEEH